VHGVDPEFSYCPLPRVGGALASGVALGQATTAILSLVAIIDWATRRVPSWRLSNTLTAGFCVEALSEAGQVVTWCCVDAAGAACPRFWATLDP
jgi:hypothetical protein